MGDGIAAAFEYVGPAESWVKALKYGGKPFLAKGASAFLAAQLVRTGWPLPDVIVPVPIAFNHWLKRGYNQSLLLAKELGLFIGRPTMQLLHRDSGDFSQAGLSSDQRRRLKGDRIKIRKSPQAKGKRILLVDDVYTTGSTLRTCIETLASLQPVSIHALVFCRA